MKRIYLGGTGRMFSTIEDGVELIFKPAESRWDWSPLHARAYVQQFAYFVQNLVDPTSAVSCKIATRDGMFGTLQKRFELLDTDDGTNFAEKMLYRFVSRGDIAKKYLNQLLREFVVDYLINNFDSHFGNFIVSSDGILRGIDKEQAFKYWKDPESQVVSKTYSPNCIFGTPEPVYNRMFDLYSKNKLDLDFDYLLSLIKKVEEYPLEDYAKECRPVAKEFESDETSQKEMFDFMIDRKQNIRKNIFNNFIEKMGGATIAD